MRKFRYLEKNKISSLPKSPGIYIFKKGREIFYIGKAGNTRERVKNHFQSPNFRDKLFIQDIKKIGYLKTQSEIEALILEASLIKKEQPKFNVLWRDDKNYFFVGATEEDFPRIFLTHQPKLLTTHYKLKTIYQGPFVEGTALKQTLKVLRKVFPYRTCKKIPKKPCLWYQLERCPGACTLQSKLAEQIPGMKGKIKKESQRNVKNLIKVLQGKKAQALIDLKREMKKFSQVQKFEKAAKLRDQLESLKNVFEHSQILQGLIEVKAPDWKETEKKLKKILGRKRKIGRIEGYDVSNIQGQTAAGAMIVFENGVPNKNEYRKFKIKITGKPNDVAMLKEILSRRLKHPEWRFPDLILIDGGRAQLNAALQVKRQETKIKNVNVIALAKRKNELYIEGKGKPVLLKKLPQEVSNLILQIRDESHRFAVKYHRKLRYIDFLK